MGILRGIIRDGTSGALVEAKVHVLSCYCTFLCTVACEPVYRLLSSHYRYPEKR